MTNNEAIAYLIAIGAGLLACILAFMLERRRAEIRKLRHMLYGKDVKNFILIQKIKEQMEPKVKG